LREECSLARGLLGVLAVSPTGGNRRASSVNCNIRRAVVQKDRPPSSLQVEPGTQTTRRLAPRWLGFALVLGFLLTPIGAGAVEVSLVPLEPGVDPADITLAPGETIRLAVEVDDVPSPGLAAFQFEIQFDPTVVQLSNPNEAYRGSIDPFAPLGNNPFCTVVRGTGTCEDPDWLLTSTGRSVTGTDEIDNVTGRILVAYGTSGAQSLPTGPGTLALVDVTAVGTGTTDLSFFEVILADDSEPPQEYSTTTVGAHVTVVERVPALSPIGRGLMAALLLGIPLAVRRRHKLLMKAV